MNELVLRNDTAVRIVRMFPDRLLAITCQGIIGILSLGIGFFKAYDKVSHYKLFSKLLRLGTPVYLVKILANGYAAQPMQIKLDNSLSEPC